MNTDEVVHKVKLTTWTTENRGQSHDNLRTLLSLMIRNSLAKIGLEDIALEIYIGCEGPHERNLIMDVYGLMDDMEKTQWEISGGFGPDIQKAQ